MNINFFLYNYEIIAAEKSRKSTEKVKMTEKLSAQTIDVVLEGVGKRDA